MALSRFGFFAPELRVLLNEPFLRHSAPALGRFIAEGSQPAINLEENARGYELSAEVPGWKREELSIEFKEGDRQTLIIKGNRATAAAEEPIDVDKAEKTTVESESRTWLSERSSHSFSRSLRLPERIDLDAVKAKLADGLLRLELPKAAKPEPRQVNIE